LGEDCREALTIWKLPILIVYALADDIIAAFWTLTITGRSSGE
jgi:hypothetical protein